MEGGQVQEETERGEGRGWRLGEGGIMEGGQGHPRDPKPSIG